MRGKAASRQPAEDTSPLQPKSKPPAPCCHSILQRRLLRKSDAGPRGLLGVVVQAADSEWRGRDGSWAVLDTLNGCRVGWSRAPLKHLGRLSFTTLRRKSRLRGGATTDHALRVLVFWCLGLRPRGFTIYIVFFLELA